EFFEAPVVDPYGQCPGHRRAAAGHHVRGGAWWHEAAVRRVERRGRAIARAVREVCFTRICRGGAAEGVPVDLVGLEARRVAHVPQDFFRLAELELRGRGGGGRGLRDHRGVLGRWRRQLRGRCGG